MSPNPRARNLFAYPINESSGKLPLSTEVYTGPTDVGSSIVARGRSYQLFLTPAEAALTLQARRRKSKKGRGICSILERAATHGS